MLAGISEENLLVQLEIEYQGDITSCNKVATSRVRVSITVAMYRQVENYLMCSEYERQHMMDLISEDDSFNSSQVQTIASSHS